MKRKSHLIHGVLLSTAALCTLSVHSAFADLRSFAEAEGFGAVATGARAAAAPTVYHVTNLNNSGAGSFRDAVSVANRIVVFDTSGVITLTSEVGIQSNITIAGQTAPGGGIMITGAEVSMGSQTNVIMRHLRFRPGDGTSNTANGLNLHNAGTVILDHVSVEFAKWNNIDSVTDKGYFTIQNSVIADPINQQFNAHMESLAGPVTWSNNLLANAHNRNPLAKMDTIFKNNIDYNNSANYTAGNTSGHFDHDIVNNYFIAGPGTTDGDVYFQVNSNQTIYSSGNKFDSNQNTTLDGSTLNPPGGVTLLNAPWSPLTAGLPTLTAAQAYTFVINHAGASIARDDLDNLVISQAQTLGNGTTGTGAGTAGPNGGMYSHATDTGLSNGGLGTITEIHRAANFDSDLDGIPDAWETSHGLNPATADSLLKDPLGYFMIEKYINELGNVNDIRTASSGAWTTAATWSPIAGAAYAPLALDNTLIRGTGAANGAVTLASGAATALSLSIGGNGPVSGESLTATGGTLTVYDTITVGDQNNATLQLSTNANVTAANVILGNSTFSAAATTHFTGTLNLLGGTLTLAQLVQGGGKPSAGFTTGGLVNFSGGTLRALDDLTVTAPITFTNAPTIDSNSFNGNISSVLSGTGGFIKKGAGTLALSAANTFTGVLTIQTGAISASTLADANVPGPLGNGADASKLVFDGGTFAFTGAAAATTNRLFTLTPNGGTIDNSAGASLGFTGTGQIALAGTGPRTLTLTGSHYNANGNDAFAPGITDTAGTTTTLLKSNTGRWFITGTPKLYTGDTLITGGDLYTDVTNVLPFGPGKGNVNISAGRLFIFSGSLNINALTGTGGAVDASSSRTITVGNGDASGTFAGNVQGSIALVKTGTGTQILNGTANVYSGSTTVNAGILRFNSTIGGGAGVNLTVNSAGTFAVGFALDQTLLARFTPASSGVIALAAASSTNLDFSAANLPTAFLGAVGAITYSGQLTPGANGYRLGGGGGSLTLSNPLALTGAAPVLIGSTGDTGPSVVSIATAQSYTGVTTLHTGTTLIAGLDQGGVASGLGQSSNAAANLVLDGGTLRGAGSTDRTFTLTTKGGALDNSSGGLFTSTATIALPASSTTLTLTGSNTGHISFSPALADPASGQTALTKTGNGKWTFNVANNKTYSGDTHITAGTLESLAANAFSKNSNIVLDPAGVLELHAYSNTINALSGSGSVFNSFGTASQSLTVGFANGTGTFSGAMNGAMSFVKTGTGSQTLSGSYNYTGATTVSGGTFIFTKGLTFSSGLFLNSGIVQLAGTTNGSTTPVTIAGSTNNWSAKLDLTTNALIQQTSAPTKPAQLATLFNQITTGLNGANGITSSTAALDPAHFTVALFDNALLGMSTFANTPVDANSLIVTQALWGDANLDNTVNSLDLTAIANNWLLRNATNWAQGDVNNDHTVDDLDVQLVLAHWDAATPFTAQTSFTPTFSFTLVPVPEPASIVLLVLAAPLLLRRRD